MADFRTGEGRTDPWFPAWHAESWRFVSKLLHALREIFTPVPKPPPVPPPMPPLSPEPTRTEMEAEMLSAQTHEWLRRVTDEFDRIKYQPRQGDQ
jgi:hypothetical protein